MPQATKSLPSTGQNKSNQAVDCHILASTACAQTRPSGTMSNFGAPTSCSLTWRRYFAVSNQSWACAPSTTTKKNALMATCSSPYWPTNSYSSSGGASKKTLSMSAGRLCVRSCPYSGVSPLHSDVPTAGPCMSAKPPVRKQNWQQSTTPLISTPCPEVYKKPSCLEIHPKNCL